MILYKDQARSAFVAVWKQAGQHGYTGILSHLYDNGYVPGWQYKVTKHLDPGAEHTRIRALKEASVTKNGVQWCEQRADLSTEDVEAIARHIVYTTSHYIEVDVLDYILESYELSNQVKKELAKNAIGEYAQVAVLRILADTRADLDVGQILYDLCEKQKNPLRFLKGVRTMMDSPLGNQEANELLAYGLENNFSNLVEYILEQDMLDSIPARVVTQLGSAFLEYPQIDEYLTDKQILSQLRAAIQYGGTKPVLDLIDRIKEVVLTHPGFVLKQVIFDDRSNSLYHTLLDFVLSEADIDPDDPPVDNEAGELLANCIKEYQFGKAKILVEHGANIEKAFEHLEVKLSDSANILKQLDLEDEQFASIII